MVTTIAQATSAVPSAAPAPRYIRVKEGAAYCGLSESEIYRAIYAGELKALRYRSRSWLITTADIDAWIDSQSVSNVA